MKKEAQVVMLPMDRKNVNSGAKIIGKVGNVLQYTQGIYHLYQTEFQHLYIVDDSEIKEGDWCLFFWDGMKYGELGQVGSEPQQYFPENGHTLNRNLKKIIGTTDPSLVINAVDIHEVQGQVMQSHYHKELPQLPQSFIEEYCKNPVEKVMVEYESYIKETSECDYALEKPKLTSNNELIIHPIEEKLYTREEVAELCAKAYWDGNLNTGDIIPENWIKENL